MNLRNDLKRHFLRLKLVRRMVRSYFFHRTEYFVIAYPKCGRTWVRVMLGKALALHYQIPLATVLDPSDVIKAGCRKAPRIGFRHDGTDRIPDPLKASSKKRYQKYEQKEVIFLVRDPRDVLVSYYFHRTRRMMEKHELADFVRDPSFGIDRIIEFMNGWYDHSHIPKGFLLMRYEDIHRDPKGELGRLLEFVGIADVTEEVVSAAADYAGFENMRNLSRIGGTGGTRMAPQNLDDPESYKIRKGKVGGYSEYLKLSEIEYINTRLERELAPVFGYGASQGRWTEE